MSLKSVFVPYISSIILNFDRLSAAQNAHGKVELDPTYRTVATPIGNLAQDPDHIRVVSSILLAVSLVFLGISVSESKRWNSTVPATLTAGAASCVLAEAVNCYLSNVCWTQSHDPSQLLFTLLGRTLWVLLGLAGFFDFILEETMLQYGGIYTYYGHQSLVLFKLFPCWWPFCNVSGTFFGSAISYRYRAWFDGWRSVFLLPILPFCYIGPQVLAAMPTVYVVQADHNPLTTQLCGMLTCCIAVVQTGIMMYVVLHRDPLDFGGFSRNLRFDMGKTSHSI
ncbi:unnamed protein product [Fusarium graminearum]|uniref:Uncharacterized protein n=1 Tax=Gibberella zeae TaxID=5518 RepID=A0A9N8NC36_GIBZA|nr:unnamed protein product [Fusarium graminearum]